MNLFEGLMVSLAIHEENQINLVLRNGQAPLTWKSRSRRWFVDGNLVDALGGEPAMDKSWFLVAQTMQIALNGLRGHVKLVTQTV